MVIKGLIFDINGTLTDIRTNEWHSEVYRVMSNLLVYQGVFIGADELQDLYFSIMKAQRSAGGERYPEFDAAAVFREIIRRHATGFTRRLPAEKLKQLPLLLAETFRAASLFHLKLYAGVEDTIKQLARQYRLAVVSDGQTAYAIPELNAVGLLGYFDPIIISGDFGYRKPDQRLFEKALNLMQLQPANVLFIGNDMYHDVGGAQKLGIRTVFFKSNQGQQARDGVEPDYIIYNFPELLKAVRFFTGQSGG